MTTNTRRVANPGSALGEAVGKLFEAAVLQGLEEVVAERGYAIRPARLQNGKGNTYQLAGRWSAPSLALIRSFGVETLEVPFAGMASVLREYEVNFDWPEKDRATPRAAWEHFSGLDDATRAAIAHDLVAGVIDSSKPPSRRCWMQI